MPNKLPNSKRKGKIKEKSPKTLPIEISFLDKHSKKIPPSPTAASPPPLHWWQALAIAILAGLTVLAVPIIVRFIIDYNKEDNIKARLWKAQDDIQKIDELINDILSKNQNPPWKGQQEYIHPDTGEIVGKDYWANGKLIKREFFRSGHDIAYDRFIYVKDTIWGKDRDFIDNYKRVFLKDNYLQDGILNKKQYFPNGQQNNPIEYVREKYQSPLPPLGIIFYR